MNGVVVSSSPQDEDDDIEFVGVVVGEERQMSKVRERGEGEGEGAGRTVIDVMGYCEIVMESIMKKELNENADNEVIYIEEKKGNGKVRRREERSKEGNINLHILSCLLVESRR